MIVTEAQTDGAAGGEAREVFLDALANRLQRFKPRRSLDHVDAHAFRRTVIDAANTVTAPSASVNVAVASVPHI